MMGTSVNHRSPRTTNWRSVDISYTNTDITLQRTVQEIWRASLNDNSGLANSLGGPLVAQCIDILQTASSSSEAAQKIGRAIALSGSASLAGDIARRAAVIAYGEVDRTRGFIQSIFSEASNHLISRDIPGFVGLSEKLKTVTDATSFKGAILREVNSNVATIPLPSQRISDPQIWNTFVSNVIRNLTRDK